MMKSETPMMLGTNKNTVVEVAGGQKEDGADGAGRGLPVRFILGMENSLVPKSTWMAPLPMEKMKMNEAGIAN
jgi:hypothetical protein